MPFSELRGAVLGSVFASVQTKRLRFPNDGSLGDLLGVVLAFGDGRQAFCLSTNSSGNGVFVRAWDPAPVDMGQ